ncbi:hypothetical protein GALL_232210 [mine drainage metagenome]|uniref:Uncharacterized protein n=1 Tax=mine drainage metagenome TaxID=410659 RepID=A0A1J5RF89_9ZZZZ
MTSRLRLASIVSAVLLTSAGALYAQGAAVSGPRALPGLQAPAAQCASGVRGVLGY